MVVCKYFLQGNCRFGANCRNEHPAGQGGAQGGSSQGGFGNSNRFGPSSNTGNGRFGNNNDRLNATFFHRGDKFATPVPRSQESHPKHENKPRARGLSDSSWANSCLESSDVPVSGLIKSSQPDSKQYTLNIQDVKLDLTRGNGRPNWVLSTYGAGRGTPASLFEGNEYSPEEIRVRFYEMASKGQEGQADQEAIQLWTKAEQDLDNALNHIDDISKFMKEAERNHPNRYDFLKADGTQTRGELAKAADASGTGSTTFGAPSAFGQASNSSSPFAKPAAATFGQSAGPSAFGSSTFGKPAQSSAFGQPAFGQSGFGAAPSSSGFGQTGDGFGQSNNASPFGQTASAGAFGKPAFGQSGFGQPAFGQSAQSSSSGFGQPAQPSNQSPFGQTASTPAFGQSSFGQAPKPNPFGAASASSGFGSTPSGFGQQTQPASTFGQPSQPTSAFGQSPQPSSGFGQSAFGKPAQPGGFGQPAFGQSTFGQPAQATSNSAFSQPANASSGFGFRNNAASAFGQTTQSNASPFAKAAEPTTTEISMDADTAPIAVTQTSDSSNQFGSRQTSMTTAQTSAGTPAANPSLAQPITNTSQIPHALMSKPPQPLHYTQTLPMVPSQTNMSNRLTSYRGQRVEYLDGNPNGTPCYTRPDGKGPEKIWFPEASATQEVAALNKEDKIPDLQQESGVYTDAVKAQYGYLFEQGRWKDGKIPLVPPLREWCVYDF